MAMCINAMLAGYIQHMYTVAHIYNYIYPYSAGINFRRQNVTSVDVRFWRLKQLKELKYF